MAVAARHVAATGGTGSPELVAVPRATGPSLVLLGSVIALVGAWGAIAPYVAPLFGLSPDGTAAWHWSLAHALLGFAPGGVAAVAGVMLLAAVGRATAGRGRLDVGLLGFVVALCGAWFTIGEFAWPVLYGSSAYFVGAGSLHILLEQLAFSIGTGVVLVGCGAFAIGWAARHQRRARRVREARTTTAVASTTPVG
ncbi:MAG: hypothetical protein ACRDYZ_12530 [Acidimicrobiales bacterium]